MSAFRVKGRPYKALRCGRKGSEMRLYRMFDRSDLLFSSMRALLVFRIAEHVASALSSIKSEKELADLLAAVKVPQSVFLSEGEGGEGAMRTTQVGANLRLQCH
jgi:hypothetical protein